MYVRDEGLSGLKCGKQEDLVSKHPFLCCQSHQIVDICYFPEQGTRGAPSMTTERHTQPGSLLRSFSAHPISKHSSSLEPYNRNSRATSMSST